MLPILIVRESLSRDELRRYALDGSFVKAVVDCARNIMAIGGELHADEEHQLLTEGSRQEDLWGINLYPDRTTSDWIEFDSMINIRPRQGNRSRSIEDIALQKRIYTVVSSLVR